MARIKRLVSIVGVVTLFGPMVGDVVFGCSGGPVRNVTDLAPTCAGCHSSFTRDQLRNEPEAFATSQIKENKHYKAIEDGTGPYQQMSAADRQKLLADVKAMDENASMALSVPTSLRAGQEVQVTVSVKGGHGGPGRNAVHAHRRGAAQRGARRCLLARHVRQAGDGDRPLGGNDGRPPSSPALSEGASRSTQRAGRGPCLSVRSSSSGSAPRSATTASASRAICTTRSSCACSSRLQKTSPGSITSGIPRSVASPVTAATAPACGWRCGRSPRSTP